MTKLSGLSKSRVMTGIQCEKALYLGVHEREMASKISKSQQMLFDQGHLVGLEAHKHFPGGFAVIASHTDSQSAINETKKAIENGALHIFEATFLHEGVLVKVDVLSRSSERSHWEIFEVKSSTSVKDEHLQDAAIQLWVLRGSGLKIKSVSIMHINNQCTYPDLTNLFTVVNVTSETERIQENLVDTVRHLQNVLSLATAPTNDIGPHCGSPYECNFKDYCWSAKNIPLPSVFNIPRLSEKKKWEYYGDGVITLDQLNPDEFNVSQTRMIESSIAGARYVNARNIRQELSTWQFPLSFLDFETIGFAIPRYDGQRPYQQMPFQFSCHVLQKPGKQLDHFEYLHSENSDPRRQIAQALEDSVPKTGSVVAYNSAFEKRVLLDLANENQENAAALRNIADRLVDPLPLIRANVYDPAFFGSFSLKAVAPALLGSHSSYDGMAVEGGDEAQAAFLELIDGDTSDGLKSNIRASLLEYCMKDTLYTAEIVKWLFGQ